MSENALMGDVRVVDKVESNEERSDGKCCIVVFRVILLDESETADDEEGETHQAHSRRVQSTAAEECEQNPRDHGTDEEHG